MQHRADAPPPVSEPARLTLRRTQGRWLPWVLAFTTCALALNALIGDRSFAEARRRQQQLARTASHLDRLRQVNAELRGQVRRLRQDPYTIEAIARGELGLIRKGERVFLIKDVGGGLPPAPLTAPPRAR